MEEFKTKMKIFPELILVNIVFKVTENLYSKIKTKVQECIITFKSGNF
jgi:hypothetical protein